MATKVGEGYVDIVPEFKGFQRDVQREVERTTSKASQVASKAIKGGAILSATVTPAVLAGLKGAVDAASDLNESLNAVDKSYGEAASGVMQLGEEAAQALGLSNSEFNSLAVRFSSFAQTIAGDGGDVVGTLDDLTTRASDFASVMNLEVSDAAEKFQSGLAGETEPLRQFGIDLSAAAVEAYALEEGIIASAGSMTESEKITARYGLLMEETAQFQGDFAETSEDAANAQRIAAAEWENAQAALGDALLPVMSEAAGIAQDVLGAFNNLPDAGQKAVLFAGIGAAAIGPLTTAVGTAIKAVEGLSSVAGKFKWGELGKTGRMAAIAAGVAAIGIAAAELTERDVDVSGLADGLDQLAETGASARWDAATEGTEGLTLSLNALYDESSRVQAANVGGSILGLFGHTSDWEIARQQVEAMDTTLAELVSSGDIDTAARGWAELTGAASAADVPIESLLGDMPALTDALAVNGIEADDLSDRYQEIATELYGVPAATQAATTSTDEYRAALEKSVLAGEGMQDLGLAATTEDIAGATHNAAIEFRDLSEAAATVEEAVSNLDARFRDMVDGQRDIRAATSDWEASLDGLTASIETNGTTLDLASEKGRANESAIRAAQDAAIDHALAVLEETQSIDEANAALDQHRDDLEEVLVQSGLSEEAARQYTEEILKIPDDAETRAEFDDAAARQQISGYVDTIYAIPENRETYGRFFADRGELESWIGRLQSLNRTITTRGVFKSSGGPTALHSGTAWHPGGPAIVNDAPGGTQGELINLPGGSSVTSSRDSVQMLATAIRAGMEGARGGAGTTVNLTVNGNPDPGTLFDTRQLARLYA